MDVEPDFMIMSAPRLDKGSTLESDMLKDKPRKGSDMLDPVFDDRTQTSVEAVESTEQTREKMLQFGSPVVQSQGSEGIKGKENIEQLLAKKPVKDAGKTKSKEKHWKSREKLVSKETQSESARNTKKKKSREKAEAKKQ